MNQQIHWLGLSLAIVVLDQLTKVLAVAGLTLYEPVPLLPLLNLTLMYNTGAAFSFLADAGGWQRWVLSGFALLVTAVLIYWLLRTPRQAWWLAAALALVIGGALGNLIDRVIYGYVIDFIDFYIGTWHWPAFNIADSAITIGVILLLFDSLRSSTIDS